MLLIPCPWCGPRDEIEFTCSGQARVRHLRSDRDLDDREWSDYLFMRDNPRGNHRERWHHIFGCRQWFIVERNTVTHHIVAVHRFSDDMLADDRTATP